MFAAYLSSVTREQIVILYAQLLSKYGPFYNKGLTYLYDNGCKDLLTDFEKYLFWFTPYFF